MGVEAARAALRGRRPRARRRGLLRHGRPRLPRQDQRHRHPRRPRPRPSASAFDMVGSVRSAVGRAARGGRRAAGGRRWPCCPTSAPACPAGPTSATAATPPPPSCSAPGRARRRARRADRRRRRPPASSSTAGARPATRPRGSGRSASASTSTARWPRRRVADACKAGRHHRRRRRPPHRRRPRTPGRSSALAKAVGARPEALVDDLTAAIGNAGAAQPGLLLADVARPGGARRDHRAGHRWPTAPTRRLPDHRRRWRADRQAVPHGRRADRGRQRRPALRHVPDLAGPAPPRAAPPARPRARRRRRRRPPRRGWKFGFIG